MQELKLSAGLIFRICVPFRVIIIVTIISLRVIIPYRYVSSNAQRLIHITLTYRAERMVWDSDFLEASSHLYMSVCPPVGPSVGPSVRKVFLVSKSNSLRGFVRPSVGLLVRPSVRRFFSNWENMKETNGKTLSIVSMSHSVGPLVRPSVNPLVHRSVGPSVGPSVRP